MIYPIQQEDCKSCEDIGKLSLPIHYSQENLSALIENSDYTLLKAETITNEGNKYITGLIVYRKTLVEETFDYINHVMSIAVHPQYRRHHIGTILMNAVKSANKPISLYVQTVNKIAVEFYKKHGFIILSEIEDYYETLEEQSAYLMIYG